MLVPIPLHGGQRVGTTVHFNTTTYLARKQCQSFHPMNKSLLKFGLVGHQQMNMAHGIDGSDGALNHYLTLDGSKKIGAEFTVERIGEACFLVQTQHEVGYGIFLHRMRYTTDHIDRPAAESLDSHIG